MVGASFEFVFQNHEILIAEADDRGDFRAHGVQLFGNGQCDGAAYAAADNADLLKAVYMRWYAKRAYEVVQTFTFV